MLRENAKGIKEIRELAEKTVPPIARQARPFVDGDHWQGGAGWIGPMPRQQEEGFSETMQVLEAGFVSANRVEEVCDRHAGGVVGREPQWGFTPLETPDEDGGVDDSLKEAIRALEDPLTWWWNERGVHEKLYDAVMYMAWGGRATLRLYVPSGLRDEPIEGDKDLRAYLSRIYVDVVAPEFGTVHRDPATMKPLGVVLYKNEEDKDVTEFSYLDQQGHTVIEVAVGDETPQKSDPLDMGGRITMHELSRRPIVSPQLLQQQKAHNLALSILSRNLVTAGFLERVLINAQQPGHWELDPDTKQPIRFVPKRLSFGSGTVTWVTGVETVDAATGKTTTATPDVKYRDPVSPEPTVAAARATYTSILEEAQQAHILMNADANASGRSRQEARKDFESSLRYTAPVVERAGRWLLETAVAFAEALMGTGAEAGSLSKFRCDFMVRLDTGTITPEEMRQNDESVKAGTLPREYAIAARGYDDVDAAITLINERPGAVLDEMLARAKVALTWTQAGASLDAAAEAAGVPDEMLAVLKRGMVNMDPEGRGGDEDDEE